jgi:hypothetical protein
MKRLLFLLAVTAAAIAVPGTALAARGVALTKDQARHAVVVAGKGGVVRTVRAPGRLGKARVGHRVVYAARRLADGTFRARAIRSGNRVSRATFRGVLVRDQRRVHRLLISAGGSVFAVRAPARGFASSDHTRAGDRVEVRVRLTGHGLDADDVTVIGHTGTLELEGIFLSVDGNRLRLAVDQRGEVFVTVPAGLQLPQLRPGDEIELIVTVDAAGAFTLVSVQVDDEDDDQGIGEENGKIEVHGQITAFPAGAVTVQSKGGSPVTCAVPAGVDLSAFKVGDRVEMRCANVSGHLTLFRLRKDDDEGGDDGGHHGGDGSGG